MTDKSRPIFFRTAYLIGIDGTAVEKQGWYEPQQMEKAVISYLDK